MEFVLLLSRNHVFGWLIRPALADEPDASGRRHRERFVQGVADTAGMKTTPGISQILQLIQSHSDSELTRRFAPKGTTVANFVKGPDRELLENQIRPFLDIQTDEILKLAAKERIALYLQDESTFLYPGSLLSVQEELTEPLFHFIRGENQTTYRLQVRFKDLSLNLKDPRNFILTSQPCRFLYQNLILSFPEGFDGKKLLPFLSKTEILIPRSTEKKYFETFILKVLKTGEVKAEGFTVLRIVPGRRMELSAELDWQGKAILVIYFWYGSRRIMAGKPQKVFIDLKMDGEEVVFTRSDRDPEWEREGINRCVDAGLMRSGNSALVLPGQPTEGRPAIYRLAAWIGAHSDMLKELDVSIETRHSPVHFITGAISSRLSIVQGSDWFDIHGEVSFGTFRVAFIEIREFIREGIREFPLPDGHVAIIPEEWFARYGDLCHYSSAESGVCRLKRSHLQIVRDLSPFTVSGFEDPFDKGTGDGALAGSMPGDLQAKLRPYQEEGLSWLNFLRHYRFGGFLADDMGLGKTLQTIALLLQYAGHGSASLVIMPASLVHNWRHEIRRFAPSLRFMEYVGSQRPASTSFFDAYDVVLTTYGIVRNDIEKLTEYPFHYVILDESQVIKNPAALISKAVYLLKSRFRLVLTGTPIENSLTDLWSQMEFLNPGMLGSLQGFQKRYQTTVIAGEDPDAGEVPAHLRKIIAPFILRRTKAEVEPDLPPLTVRDWYCEMTEEHRHRYETLKSGIRNEILDIIDNKVIGERTMMILRELVRLRQCASHPLLIDPGYQGGSGKLDEVVQMASTLIAERQKTLIFSSFVRHLQLISAYFDRNGIHYSILTGATHRREQVIRRFREEEECRFFLISLKAGGMGLNLSEAGYVMLLDPWWNPAAEIQAISRSHRIGQEKKVIAYRFITTATIEEKILRLQERKQALADAFIPPGNPLKDMTQEEIRGLFI